MKRNILRDMFVALAKAIAPNWVITNKTKKSNPDATDWLLSYDKEMGYIEKHQPTPSEMKERLWSDRTRLELLKQENYTLVSDWKRDEEFMLLIDRADKLKADVFIEAINGKTPSVKLLKAMIKAMPQATLMKVADVKPQAFNDMRVHEVLGYDEPVFLLDSAEKLEKNWALAKKLVEYRPKLWAKGFLDIIQGEVSGDYQSLYTWLFYECMKQSENENMVGNISYVYSKYPVLYAYLRRCMLHKTDVAEYVKVMLGKLMDSLTTLVPVEPWTRAEKQDDAVEAYYWYTIALGRIQGGGTYPFMMGNIGKFKACLDAFEFAKLVSVLSENACSIYDIEALLKETKKDTDIDILHERMWSISKGNASTIEVVAKKYFPFEDWKNKGAMYRNMVVYNLMTPERLNEISDADVRAKVIEMMQTKAQTEVLKRNDHNEWIALFEQGGKLTPEAECVMLSCHFYRGEDKKYYIKKYKLSERAFKHLLDMKPASKSEGFSYLLTYAEAYGLTEEEYLLVLQSQYFDNAHFIVKFVQK